MTKHMADTLEEIVKAAGGVLVNYKRGDLDAIRAAWARIPNDRH